MLDLHGRQLRSWPTDLVEGHGLTLVREDDTVYLWIADNGSKLQAEDDGSYVSCPSWAHGAALLGHLVRQNPDGRACGGGPDAVADGAPVRLPLRAGRFNTPHGIAVDADGGVYVTEWLIGGRLVRLAPRRDHHGRAPKI